ncbi:MAG TPA: hypothetical protein VJN43_10395 [Bryobacteraceae bacterium]|nr:hypothetical protein [Bryobacteraceae bacterium]
MEPRIARETFTPAGPISFIHLTEDGPVHLLVKESKSGWVSIHWSRHLAGSWTFKTMDEANAHVLQRFEYLYPGHRCSQDCRPASAAVLHESDDLWGMICEQAHQAP